MNDFTRKMVELDKECLWHPFTQMRSWMASEPVVIDSGEGFYLIDTEGRRYIDGVSSLWCNVHGHRVEKIDAALREQLEHIAHSTLLGLGQSRSIELAERLVNISPGGLKRVFYSDSGATSVEIALKMAYQYYFNRGHKERRSFIALGQSYHGDTVGSVSVGGISTFHQIFGPLLFQTHFVPPPEPYRFEGSAEQCSAKSIDSMVEILREQAGEIAAVIVEPLVQGAAGMIVHPQGFLRQVRELTREYDVLLIADEVATGFGRTGRMFACEHEDVVPDLMCMAKGITGGYLPLAATLATEQVFEAFLGEPDEHKTFYHGHTYTGNALGCAAAIASLDLFEENNLLAGLGEKADIISRYMRQAAELDYVGDVRQCGMMGGIELVANERTKQRFDYARAIGAKTCMAMRKRGIMMRPLGDVVIIMPPVAIGVDLLEELMNGVVETLREDLPGIVNG